MQFWFEKKSVDVPWYGGISELPLCGMMMLDLPYSWKNIPIPSHDAYRKKLIEMVESLIKRMRWKAFFFLRGDKDLKQDCDEKFGLKSRRCPPQIDDLKPFEESVKLGKAGSKYFERFRSWKDCVVALRKFSC